MKEFHCHKLQYSYPSLKSKLLLGPENHPYLTYNFNNETPLSDGRAAVAGKSTLLTICSLLLSGMDIYLVLPMYLDSLSATDIVDILFSSVKTFSLLLPRRRLILQKPTPSPLRLRSFQQLSLC